VDDLVGRTLGRYEITALVGRGGMATVYKARQPGLNRNVAVKVLHRHLAVDSAFVGRFRREARAVAALRHPNIVRVHDFDNEGDIYFIVMEFIDGPTLASFLKRLFKQGRHLSP
jgi:serine/threonine-protein kinase